MASFSAELRVGGHVFPLLRFTYEVHQSTDRRGRVVTKVRFGLVRLFLDVPRTDFLKAWAAAAAKRWAVDLVSLDAATGQALETLHLNGAYCVFYREVFNKGDIHTGSYVLELHLSDPDGFTITAGGPAGYVAPAAREHGTPPEALQRVPVIPQLLPKAAAVVEETLLARLWQGMLRGLTGPAGMTAGLLLMSTNSPDDPGYRSEWDYIRRNTPPTDKDRAELADLERRHAGGTLTVEEEQHLLALLARVRGLRLQRPDELRRIAPDYTGVEIVDADRRTSGEFDGINMKERLFIGDKSAEGLGRINPKTGLKHQTPEAWAHKHVFDKTVKRIESLQQAHSILPNPKTGTPAVPDINQIRGFRRLHFRVDANTPEIQEAVEREVSRLKDKYPDWEFTTQYGK